MLTIIDVVFMVTIVAGCLVYAFYMTKNRGATSSVQKKRKEKPTKEEPKMSHDDKNAEYEVITIGEGSNTHKVIKEALSKGSYKGSRFLKPRNIIDKIKNRVRFVVVRKMMGETETFITLNEKVPISSTLLFKVESSTSLRRALAGLFSKGFGGFGGKKTLFIIIIIAVVAVVGYLIYSGNINLGKILG